MGSAATVEDILATAQAEAAAEPERGAEPAVDTEEDIVNVRSPKPLFPCSCQMLLLCIKVLRSKPCMYPISGADRALSSLGEACGPKLPFLVHDVMHSAFWIQKGEMCVLTL